MVRFNYFSLNKKEKGEVKIYLGRMSGLSRAQLTRLIHQQYTQGTIKVLSGRHHSFKRVYSKADKDVLVQTDNVHGRLSGPATKRILERQYEIYGDEKFERLKGISPAHIYNLRLSKTYQLKAQTFAKTKSVHRSVGIRRKPETLGCPGWIRVDTVHQGDLEGKKGVYHINLVDCVLQW